MDKIKNVSIKRSMTLTFIITICMIGVFSGITIFMANQSQQEILKNKYLMVKSPDYERDKSTNKYTIDMDGSVVEWHGLSMAENIAYYGCYAAMIGLPVLSIIVGIGSAAALYYHMKLKAPILQLQEGMKRIQDNDLDFSIGYSSDDELGQLCRSMEKMRKELRYNSKALWETLRQRKLLNASVAHDLRTPITVLRGYVDFLEKNIPQDKLTEEMLMDTISSMQGAVLRLERYVECVRDVEKIEGIEMMFSASRSRKISIVAIIQSLAQFEKTYGKEGAEIIVDNCQCTLFGAFAPNSKTAEAMSQNLGKQTVLSGTVTRSSGRDGSNRQLQMIERPLMTVDELKSMPKGHFIAMKTGCHPMKTQLKLFFKWGIQFEDAYSIEEKSERKVQYADSKEVEAAVLKKFPPKKEAICPPKPVPMEFMDDFEAIDEEAVSRKRPPKTKKKRSSIEASL